MPSVFFVVAVLASSIVTAHAGMVGGFTEQNASDPQYMEKAWKAAKGINDERSNAGPYHMMPIKVLSAKTQVVAGVKHVFQVVYGESTCKKGDMLAAEVSAANCQLKPDARRAIYEVELWEKPWENFEQFNVKKVRTLAAGEQI
uniref:Cysteine protease inhibitor n=1 Tax=Heligmosomoides polygyrus TaxID=6339 RepID=L0HAX6_HELPZ|nr:cysteine protease inhibitor [Heligmosomoides polygyrus]